MQQPIVRLVPLFIFAIAFAACSDDTSGPEPPDPDPRFSRLIGGTSDDLAIDVVVTSDGLRVVAGHFSSDTLRVTGSAQFAVAAGSRDVFLSAFRADGSLAWMRGLGGSGVEAVSAMARDASDNLYVTGTYVGPTTLGGFDLPIHDDVDVFVARLDPQGNVNWVEHGGGTGVDRASEVRSAGDGTVYFSGDANSEFNIAGEDVGSLGGPTGFVVQVAPGGGFGRSQIMGGTGEAIGTGLAVADDHTAYTCGSYRDGNLEIDGTIVANDGDDDGFIAHFDDGFNLDGLIHVGGTGGVSIRGLVVLGDGPVITGAFVGTVDFDVNSSSGQVSSDGGSLDIFVARYNADNSLRWLRTYGTSESEVGYEIVRTSSGSLLVVGQFNSDLLLFGSVVIENNGTIDHFLVEIDGAGNAVAALRIGSPGFEGAVSVAAAGNQAIVVGDAVGDILFPGGTVRTASDADGYIFQR